MNGKIALLFIILFIALLFPNVYIGGIMLNFYITILLLVILIYTLLNNKAKLIDITDIALFSIYTFIFLLVSFINGEPNTAISGYFIKYSECIIIFILIQYCCNRTLIGLLVSALVIVISIDAIVTLIQFTGASPIGFGIWSFINFSASHHMLADTVTSLENAIGTGQELRGSFAPGIFSTTVENGYILSSLLIFIFLSYYKSKTLIFKTIFILLLIATIYALFVVQQRTAFAVGLVIVALTLYSNNKVRFSLLAVAAVLFFFIYEINFNIEQAGRLLEFEDNQRERIYSNAIDFISNNLFTGGRSDFLKFSGISPHNLIFNAFIYGGIFGAIFLLTIYCRMCFKALIVIKLNFSRRLNVQTSCAYGLLAYNLISLTHNNSLATGDPIIFILYALMLKSQQYNIEDGK